MRAFKEEERSVLVSVTSMKGIAGFKSNYANYWHLVLYVCEGPNMCDNDLKERFLSFFICSFLFFAIRISRFLSFLQLPVINPRPPAAGILSSFYRHPINGEPIIFVEFQIYSWKESPDSHRTCPVLKKQFTYVWFIANRTFIPGKTGKTESKGGGLWIQPQGK